MGGWVAGDVENIATQLKLKLELSLAIDIFFNADLLQNVTKISKNSRKFQYVVQNLSDFPNNLLCFI